MTDLSLFERIFFLVLIAGGTAAALFYFLQKDEKADMSKRKMIAISALGALAAVALMIWMVWIANSLWSWNFTPSFISAAVFILIMVVALPAKGDKRLFGLISGASGLSAIVLIAALLFVGGVLGAVGEMCNELATGEPGRHPDKICRTSTECD